MISRIPACSQRLDRVVDHRPVVDRKKMFVRNFRQRPQPRTESARQHDPFTSKSSALRASPRRSASLSGTPKLGSTPPAPTARRGPPQEHRTSRGASAFRLVSGTLPPKLGSTPPAPTARRGPPQEHRASRSGRHQRSLLRYQSTVRAIPSPNGTRGFQPSAASFAESMA